MTFDQQYIKTLEKVYDLTKDGRTEEIVNDISIPKIFGAWSSIFWALPQLDRFRDFNINDLKKLLQALVKSHCEYKATTNQHLRTDTIDWIARKFVIIVSVFSKDQNEGLYAEYWTRQLFVNPETLYIYNSEIGKNLSAGRERNTEISNKLQEDKQNRIRKNEVKELRQDEKKKAFFEHLERNKKQKEKREGFLTEFSKLNLLEKIKVIVSGTKPLHFYPTDCADVEVDILKSLSWEQRSRLFQMINKYRIKEWYQTKERIQQIDQK